MLWTPELTCHVIDPHTGKQGIFRQMSEHNISISATKIALGHSSVGIACLKYMPILESSLLGTTSSLKSLTNLDQSFALPDHLGVSGLASFNAAAALVDFEILDFPSDSSLSMRLAVNPISKLFWNSAL